MSKIYCVYCHTNKINGKKYIGITSRPVKQRWQNGRGYYNNTHFWSAIQKYGWDNFEHEILYTNLSKQYAEELEVKLIAYYKSNNDKFGYNIEAGGNASGKTNEKTKLKISNKMRGKVIGQETREKISKANKGRVTNIKPIICVETGIVYKSGLEAKNQLGINNSHISEVCNGKRKTAGGFKWEYLDKFNEGGIGNGL